jgi:hypothetical protein
MVREAEGRPPSTAHIDELLDERSAATFAGSKGPLRRQVTAPEGACKRVIFYGDAPGTYGLHRGPDARYAV